MYSPYIKETSDYHWHYRLACMECGKSVSSPFVPLPNEISQEIIIRAIITCPECLEKESNWRKADAEKRDHYTGFEAPGE